MSKVADVNKEYFGKDKKKTYIKDDFAEILRAAIQREVILHVLVEVSKARHTEEKYENGSVVFGDFDPDNAGLLMNIFKTYEKGFMINIRQLLTPRETGAGGKFIKDIQALNVEDLIDFYKNSKPGSVRMPTTLLSDWINTHAKNKSIKGADFIDNNHIKIERAVNYLVEKAQTFQSEGYYNKIVNEYQALEFHKDHQPGKYNVYEESSDLTYIIIKKTTRSRKSKVETSIISDCLNDFAEIVMAYRNLIANNTNFLSSNWPLDVYIERTFALFSKEISNDIKKKVVQDIAKYLQRSIEIVGWNYKNN